jgi:hypothetical protein
VEIRVSRARQLTVVPYLTMCGRKLTQAQRNKQPEIDDRSQCNVTLGAFMVQGSEFALTQNNCGGSVAKLTGCSVAVVFKPSGTGLRTGMISITPDVGNKEFSA